MKIERITIALTVCVALAGCGPRYSVTVEGPKGKSAGAEVSVCELIARYLVEDEPRGKTILVSVGESWTDHVDPPDRFFERLADTQVSLQPVSQHVRIAKPKTLLLVIHIQEWVSETEARVSVTRFRFGVGAADGFNARVEWRDGIWRFVETMDHWST